MPSECSVFGCSLNHHRSSQHPGCRSSSTLIHYRLDPPDPPVLLKHHGNPSAPQVPSHHLQDGATLLSLTFSILQVLTQLLPDLISWRIPYTADILKALCTRPRTPFPTSSAWEMPPSLQNPAWAPSAWLSASLWTIGHWLEEAVKHNGQE